MQLIFESLEELQGFVAALQGNPAASLTAANPKASTVILPVSKAPEVLEAPAAPTKRAYTKKTPAEKAEKNVTAKKRPKKSINLTDSIRTSIQSFIEKKETFTANAIYDVLAKDHPEINKQSVITSVLKQMNTLYPDMERTERQGNGPRLVKVYVPKGAKIAKAKASA